MEGKLLTMDFQRPVQRIRNDYQKPMSDCLYFLFNRMVDEDALLTHLVRRRATCIVVKKKHFLTLDKWAGAGIDVIQVDSNRAYYRLAAYYRDKFAFPVVEVIGSSGKTTTKDMIGSILQAQYPTLISLKNKNHPRGVANNIFRLNEKHRACVFEVGMNEPGEIGFCSNLVKPDIAVLTSLQRAHLSRLGTMENIIKAKSEILNHLAKDGCLIMNGEDTNCKKFPVWHYSGEVLRFGLSPKHDIWASNIVMKAERTYFTAHVKDMEFDCLIHAFGKYNVGNALSAIMVGLRLGLQPDVIIQGLARFRPYFARQQIEHGPQGITVVNDNFNANPDSVRLLFGAIPDLVQNRPLILVMGDMEGPRMEFEAYNRQVHYEIGKLIGQMRFHKLIAIGKWAAEYADGARDEGCPSAKISYFQTIPEAEQELLEALVLNCVILFKASPYVQVRDLIGVLKRYWGDSS
ncbi:UDP-N-acetylmuramoyl-tripeptide--D-alanyl-D-alanine ligase [Gorillibacterium massiliense]|uniref:UDP-N-acetylmuramoyl-tripeptide--D-alanyl-D- alanine ligase n=1 Tax=Gorillibacterium massiliense TaxID=1280390 RepID=UPI00138E211E|nr:UDP-N-acetylmuramoyl-tripeptide--D-alanyl-D-alanine ligase [Gorillibacterium massiliense]